MKFNYDPDNIMRPVEVAKETEREKLERTIKQKKAEFEDKLKNLQEAQRTEENLTSEQKAVKLSQAEDSYWSMKAINARKAKMKVKNKGKKK